MSDPLATYLSDHRAGAAGAIELLEGMEKRLGDTDLGRFISDILLRVRDDRAVLDRLAELVGPTSTVKEAVAWIGEKAARLKLGALSDEDGLGTFEALETLVIGISGKRALWEALGRVALVDPRLQGIDFAALARSAQEQMDSVNERRLDRAASALSSRAR